MYWLQNTETEEIREDFFEVIMAQRDVAPDMKPKIFMTGMIAEGIYKPETNQDIKKFIKKNKCVIRGSATTYTGSVLPHEDEHIIFTGKLDSVEIKKNVATVGAGAPFYKIINEAKKYDLEVPCYPLTYKSATVGGFISNNGVVGFNSRGTGYFFDYVEELEVVTSSGNVYKVRGDDIKDYFGAEGRFGVITKVKFRLINKETRYIHMYGFDGFEDIIRFLEMNDDIYAFYFMNKTALEHYEKELQLKEIPEYSVIVIDKNWKSDYQKKLRTDLAQMGVSYVFPKEILRYCFKRIGKLEMSILSSRKSGHMGDGVVKIDDCYKVLRVAKMNSLPLFGSIGKKEVLYRIYADCNGWMKRQKFMSMMDKLHTFSEPNCVGSFFANNLISKPRALRIEEAIGKYDTLTNIIPRVQLYPKKDLRKLFGKLFWIAGRKMW